MKVDLQRFQELRESAAARQTGKTGKIAQNDWRSLLEAKRKEIGLEPAAKTADNKRTRSVAADFDGSIEERVSALRERSADGLPVRERGNFIDVRA
jgi:hypothetical protein